jgi:osmotically-inducible protein OsmY
VVGSWEARRSAESDARNTFGVLMVRNHLDVRPQADLTDLELEHRVRRALRCDPLVERRDVEVAGRSAEVALRGAVESERERRRALQAAADVKGIAGVHDHLWVEGQAGARASRQLPHGSAKEAERAPGRRNRIASRFVEKER